MIDKTTPVAAHGKLTNAAHPEYFLLGEIGSVFIADHPYEGEDSFDFYPKGVNVPEGLSFTLYPEEWTFQADASRPKPGWYTDLQAPVVDGFAPVYVDGQGRAFTATPGTDKTLTNILGSGVAIWSRLESLQVEAVPF